MYIQSRSPSSNRLSCRFAAGESIIIKESIMSFWQHFSAAFMHSRRLIAIVLFAYMLQILHLYHFFSPILCSILLFFICLFLLKFVLRAAFSPCERQKCRLLEVQFAPRGDFFLAPRLVSLPRRLPRGSRFWKEMLFRRFSYRFRCPPLYFVYCFWPFRELSPMSARFQRLALIGCHQLRRSNGQSP